MIFRGKLDRVSPYRHFALEIGHYEISKIAMSFLDFHPAIASFHRYHWVWGIICVRSLMASAVRRYMILFVRLRREGPSNLTGL